MARNSDGMGTAPRSGGLLSLGRTNSLARTGGLVSRTASLARTASLGQKPKQFYCTVFGQMDKSQTNLAVVLRVYFYPKEEMTGAMKHVEERWDDNASFKIICNHEVNSDPPSVMLCNPVCVKAKPGSEFKIDLLNQEAYLNTAEFFSDGPQLPKCLQFDISLESYNINASATDESAMEHVPAIKVFRSPDEAQVASIPLVHLCDIPDAAMTGSFAFDDFCYAVDPKPRFGVKCEHNRTWHRLPQLLVKFMTEDRGLASKVMEIAKEWENHAGMQLVHVPMDSTRDAQIRIKFSSRNECVIGTDAEDIPDDKPTMHLNVSRDTHPVLFRRRVLHQFGHAIGLYHEYEELPKEVEWDEAGVQLDTSMEGGWTTEQTKTNVFYKHSCSNNDNFDRLSIMTQTFKRSYVKGWLPRQHQSVLSVDDKSLINTLYPPPHATHEWSDPLASPEPIEEEESEEEDEDDEEGEEESEWKKAAMEQERSEMTPVDMFAGVFSDNFKDEITGRRDSDSEQPSTPPASVDVDGFGRRKRSQHGMLGVSASVEYEPTKGGKKKLIGQQKSGAASMFEFDTKASGKKVIAIRSSAEGKSFLEHEEMKYTKEEITTDIRQGDFFSFRDQDVLRQMEDPEDDRLPTPLFSPPDTPDSIPDSLAPTPVSKLFLSDTFLDIREDWINTNPDQMINLTQESLPGTRKQKMQLHPGDIRFNDAGEYGSKDYRGEKVQLDTYGLEHQEKELFGERTSVVSPGGIVERDQFYRTMGSLKGKEEKEENMVTFSEKMDELKKKKDKQEEFFKPIREHIGEADIQGMGFDAPPQRRLRGSVEYEPGQKAKQHELSGQYKGSVEFEPSQKPSKHADFGPSQKVKKGKGKGKEKKLKTVSEEDESFYNRSFRLAQQKEGKVKEDSDMSFRDKLQKREYNRAPMAAGLAELQPADEDIFDLLDRASHDPHRTIGRSKFHSSKPAPGLISTKGSFAGIGGSSSFRETGWQSYYEYDEEEMIEYEYQETKQDEDMDLMTFRERLQERSGVAIHNGVEVTPATNDTRNYLESPVPVANRSHETEEKIKNKMDKNKAGRYYDDGVDMVSPDHLISEALDRGFKSGADSKNAQDDDSEDEISKEKKEAARKHYGMRRSPSNDDVAITKQRIKAEAKAEASNKTSTKTAVKFTEKDGSSPEERLSFGFDHTQTVRVDTQNPAGTRNSTRVTPQYEKRSGGSHTEHNTRVTPQHERRSGGTYTENNTRPTSQFTPQFEGGSGDAVESRKSAYAGFSTKTTPEHERRPEVSVEADLNWNLDRSHVSAKSQKPASAIFDQAKLDEKDSPFLPPITPKKKQITSKSFVVSKEIATQITADALVPQQALGDYWVNKDTIINRSDPYADVALRMPTATQPQSAEYQQRPATYRTTTSDYAGFGQGDANRTYVKPKFERLSDDDDEDDKPNVYSRLSDAKAYNQTGQAVDVWAQRTDISFTVLLYLKKNLGINWKRAGQYLGVSRERLRRIEEIGIASARPGMEKLSQDMLFEWAEKDPQPTVAKLCAALEAADLSKLAQGVMEKVNREKMPQKKQKKTRTRKIDPAIKVPVSEETIPYRVMVYLKDNLGESWKDLAVCLKTPSPRIKGIEADAWQVEKMAYDMLHEWRQREKENATVDRLIEALERAQCKKLVKGVQARCQSYHFRVSAAS